MLYTPLTRKAMRIAYNAHHGQLDRSGVPYIFHPYQVAELVSVSTGDEYSVCAALLHDVVEDTTVTIEDLISEGFPAEVIEAVKLLTHDDSVPYLEYVRAAAQNPIAREVKRADLTHNSDSSRLPEETERDIARREKYKKALAIIEESDK